MKYINNSFRCVICASLMMLSSTAAFAVEQAESNTDTLTTDTLENSLAGTEEGFFDSNVQDSAAENASASSLMNMATPVLTLLALILSLVAIFKTKSDKNRSRRHEQEDSVDSIMSLVQSLQEKVNAQHREIAALNNALTYQEQTIKQLKQTLDHMQRPQTIVSPNSSSREKNVEVKSRKETLYASRVAGDRFPADSIASTDGNYVIAILTVEGDKGTFRINTNHAVQQNLLSTLNYGVGLISTVKSQAASPQRVDTVREGRVEREAGGWKITQKAEVRLI